jgi:chorismate dehydratase
VSYLNTRPLLYGIEQAPVRKDIELIQDYPSHIASQLLEGSIDLGLVPVAILPHMQESHIITDYCIGCHGPVASVCIFSEVPIEEVEEVLLDYQSQTSVALARILLKEYWQLQPRLIDTRIEYQSRIRGKTAGLLIGDRALAQRKVSPYIYDLGEAWLQHTGLPFAFACWISNKKLPDEFISSFNEANKWGLQHLEEVIKEYPSDVFDLNKYYTSHIDYFLDNNKREGLNLFLEKIQDVPVTVEK